MWPQLYSVCHCVTNSYAIVFTHNQRSKISHSFSIKNRHTHLLHIAQFGNDIIGRELTLDENFLAGSRSRTHNLTNSWTNVDED